MFDYKRIERLSFDALESLKNKDSSVVFESFKALDDAFLEEFPGRSYAYSGETLLARMKMIAAFIEYNIFHPNLEGIYDNLGDLHGLLEFARHQSYPGKLMSSMRWCVNNAEKRVSDLMEEHIHPDPALYNTDFIDGLPVNHDPQRIKPKAISTGNVDYVNKGMICEKDRIWPPIHSSSSFFLSMEQRLGVKRFPEN